MDRIQAENEALKSLNGLFVQLGFRAKKTRKTYTDLSTLRCKKCEGRFDADLFIEAHGNKIHCGQEMVYGKTYSFS